MNNFKVGDKVKVKSLPFSSFTDLEGTIIKKTKELYPDWDYTVAFKEKEGEFGFLKEELEHWNQAINDKMKECYKEYNENDKFKIGDRVAAYSCQVRLTGVIDCINFDNTLHIKLDNSHVGETVHYKQCRKLKKKISKNQSMLNDCLYILNCIDGQHNSSWVVQTIEEFRKKYEKKY